MSLDVYLEGKTTECKCVCKECFHEHTRKETEEFYSSNITHNLGAMAEAVGIYKHLWRPEELHDGPIKANELIEPIAAGLALLESDPVRFEKFNSANGWGLYENFVPFVRKYLEALRQYPDATVRASR
jgi:hypothetical protein